MDNLFFILNSVQALFSIGILIVLIIIAMQLREVAQALLFSNSIDTGVEIPDAQTPQQDYTNTGESLADILNKRLEKEFGDDYKNYMQNSMGRIPSYELENDFGITGCEVITDEDEIKQKE